MADNRVPTSSSARQTVRARVAQIVRDTAETLESDIRGYRGD